MNSVHIRAAALGAVVSVALFGCPKQGPAVGEACGEVVCVEGEVCDTANLLCVDDVAPTVIIESPSAKDTLAGDSVEITGTVKDDAGRLERTEVSFAGGEWAEVKVDDDGKFSATVQLPKLDAKAATLEVRAVDELEQVTIQNVEVTVDNVGPSCSFIAPAEGALIGSANGTSYEVQYRLDDGSQKLQLAELRIDDGWRADLSAVVGEGAFTWELNQTNDGVPHTLALHAVDPSGNSCDANVSFQVDLVPPRLTLTEPAEMPDPLLVGGPGADSLGFLGYAGDGSGRPTVTIDFDDELGAREVEWTSTTSEEEFVLEVPLSEVDDYILHKAVVRAVDAAGNAVEVTRNIRVDRVAPMLEIKSPTNGQNFNIANMAGGDFVSVTWDVADGDEAYVTTVRQPPGMSSTPVTTSVFPVQTLATDNGKTYEVEVTATDTAGNSSVQNVSFNVDRVAPKLISGVPPTNQRMLPASMTLVFNEPVTFQSGTTVLTPSVPLPTQTASSFTLPLEHYTIYSASFPAGMVTDAFGNPSTSTTGSIFHTEPAVPNPATFAIATGFNSQDLARLDAISDEDGVVSLVFRNASNAFEFGEIDPVSGSYATRSAGSSTAPPIMRLTISSHRELGPTPQATASMTPLRYRGYTAVQKLVAPGGGPLYVDVGLSIDASEAVKSKPFDTPTTLIVPFPPGCADPVGDPIAYIDSSPALIRGQPNGSFSQAAPFEATESVAGLSGNSWYAAGFGGSGNLEIVGRGCKCQQFSSSCSFGTPYEILNSESNGSTKIVVPGNGSSLFATYRSTTSPFSEMEWCLPLCTQSICVAKPAVTQGVWPGEGLRIAAHVTPNKIIGAWTTLTGALQLVERDVTNACFDKPWTTIATAPSSISTTLIDYRPLMFGKKPGVLYLDNMNTLRVWIP